MFDPVKAIERAEQFCEENVVDLAKEMIAWQENGVRTEGKFNVLVSMLMPPFYEHNALAVAEAMVRDAAYRKIITDSE